VQLLVAYEPGRVRNHAKRLVLDNLQLLDVTGGGVAPDRGGVGHRGPYDRQIESPLIGEAHLAAAIEQRV